MREDHKFQRVGNRGSGRRKAVCRSKAFAFSRYINVISRAAPSPTPSRFTEERVNQPKHYGCNQRNHSGMIS